MPSLPYVPHHTSHTRNAHTPRLQLTLDALASLFSSPPQNDGTSGGVKKYTGFFSAGRAMVQSEGFRGLWKGFSPAAVRHYVVKQRLLSP